MHGGCAPVISLLRSVVAVDDNLTALGRSVGVAGLRVAGLGIYLVVAPRGEPSTVHCGTLVAGFAIVREGKAALNIP